ncbi:hypothetical protein M422DRAFT_240193 [Sphaerobolus stellatus SS14]|nr:hypothetical protein M422DRAFT_240193 [Sphaerobolus stellatus SS14]
MYSFLVLAALIPSFVAAQTTEVFCDITAVNVELPSSTPTHQRYAGIGRGWSNYVCSSAGTYQPSGVDIEVVDVSCLLTQVQALTTNASKQKRSYYYEGNGDVWAAEGALGYILGPDPQKIGDLSSTSENITINFSFNQDGAYPGDSQAVLTLKIDTSFTSPTTNLDQAWKKYKVIAGPLELGTEVWQQGLRYQQPPTSCKAGTPPISIRTVTTFFITSTSSTPYKGSLSKLSTSGSLSASSGQAKNLDVTGGSSALADSSNSDDSSNIQKLLNLAPVVLGLLGALVALCVVLVGMGIASSLKGRRSSSPSRSVGATYQPVQLPRTKYDPEQPETSYRDEERYDA